MTTDLKKNKTAAWKIRRNLPAYVILTIYASIVIVPIFYAILNSFKNGTDIQQHFFAFSPKMLSLDAYKSVITLLRFGEGLKNNIIIMLLSLAITVVCSSLAAFAIVVVGTKGLKRIYTVLVMLICVPVYAFVFQLVPLLKGIGLLNTYLGTSLIFSALSIPVSVFLYTGFMKTVPKELCEAATVDGCGIWRTYFSIYMPLMITVTGTVLILRGTYIWNNLLVSMVTITDSTKTMLIPRTYAFNSSTYTRWDLVLASSVLVSLPVTVLYLAMQRVFMRGIMAGAVKG